jgi:DNA-binding LytR/AlgR family response regulator
MKYKCLIVEDNILERDSLEQKLKKIDGVTLKSSVGSGLEAVEYLKRNEIDIVFSDIDMPDLSGIELLKSLKNPPIFIFITSHTEHAAESFELDVIDYIIKPIKLERLIKAVNKAIEFLATKNKTVSEMPVKQGAPVAVPELTRTIDAQEYFFIKENNTHLKLNMGEVFLIESMGDFSKITTGSNKTHMVLVSLKNLEKQLPNHIFLRVHKQYIINILHIKNIASAEIKLTNNLIIPLSLAYKQQLQDNLINKKSLTRFIE